MIFAQGEAADAVFYVKKGRVKIAVVSEQGREAVVALLEADNFFGEGCLAGQTLRMGTASAMEKSEIMRLERASLVRILRDEPEISAMFLTHILARNIRVEEDLVDSIRPRSAWHARFFCSPISGERAGPSRSWRR